MGTKKTPGHRNVVGRPRFEDEPQKRRNITLSDQLAEKAKIIGGGNISEGIRKVIEEYFTNKERK